MEKEMRDQVYLQGGHIEIGGFWGLSDYPVVLYIAVDDDCGKIIHTKHCMHLHTKSIAFNAEHMVK